MKIIILLRNPLERAYSHWNMKVSRGNETLSFYDAIKNEPIRSKESLPYQHRIYSYIDRGFYSQQIRRLWQFFTKNQVLTLRQDELKISPDLVLKKIARFLEIRPFEQVQAKKIHALSYKIDMDEHSKQFLYNTFSHEIRQLEMMLDWPCLDWLSY